jgi:N-methylhydantoinase A
VERGHDPRTFSLLAFGGAGPLIAPLLAKEMGIHEVIVPYAPSGFSAWGMLNADVVDDASRTLMVPLDDLDPGSLERSLTELQGEVRAALTAQHVAEERIVMLRSIDVRYLGQEHTLSVPISDHLDKSAVRASFQELHRQRYGHVMDNGLQVLNVRVRGIGRTERVQIPRPSAGDGDPASALVGRRVAYDFGSRTMQPFAVYDRSLLRPGDTLTGPALVDEGTSTTVLHGDQQLRVDPHGFLLITAGADDER